MFSVSDLDFKCDSEFALKKILEIIFEDDHSKIEAYKIDPEQGLVFYWHGKRPDVTEFLVPVRTEELMPLINKWLKTVEYPKHGTGDGSYKKGWRIYNRRLDGYATFAIKPEWTYYGK